MAGNGVEDVAGGSVEVVGAGRRRVFTEAFKRRIVAEAERARPGEIGLILRREGLYSSQLAQWRQGRSGMGDTKKLRTGMDHLRAENGRLVKENERLKLKLRKAEAMLELQKKAAEILHAMDESSGSDS